MAADTVFQPETRQAAVQLLGPLEASGAEFDAIWIGGLTANNWPPAGNPSVLISRALQTKYDMPDATPADTHAWSEKLLRGLLESAAKVVGSYALVEDDVEQTVSDFLAEVEITESPPDPGWHALFRRSLMKKSMVARVPCNGSYQSHLRPLFSVDSAFATSTGKRWE
jgi:hypothetical protein